MHAGEAGLTIVVRDHGAGIQPRPARSEPPALGLGLPLIAALSDAFELRGSTGMGTEVRMTVRLRPRARPGRGEPGDRHDRRRRPLGLRRRPFAARGLIGSYAPLGTARGQPDPVPSRRRRPLLTRTAQAARS